MDWSIRTVHGFPDRQRSPGQHTMTPAIPQASFQMAQETANVQTHSLWGEYLITLRDVDDESGRLTGVEDWDITPLRTAENHFDVSAFVKPPACKDCVKIQPVGMKPGSPKTEITATVFLKNPTKLTGYDVVESSIRRSEWSR